MLASIKPYSKQHSHNDINLIRDGTNKIIFIKMIVRHYLDLGVPLHRVVGEKSQVLVRISRYFVSILTFTLNISYWPIEAG